MSAAMIHVFGTAELLEAILKEALLQGMSHRQLLLAQRVSRDWKDIIAGSPLLQKALFFRPATTDEDYGFFLKWSQKYKNSLKIGRGHKKGIRRFVMFPNRLVKKMPDLPPALVRGGAWNASAICDDLIYHDYLSSSRHGSVHKHQARRRQRFEWWNIPSASMHRMLICQPPVTTARITFVWRGLSRIETDYQELHVPTGITAGDVFQAAMRFGTANALVAYHLEEAMYAFEEGVCERLAKLWKTVEIVGDSGDDKSDAESDVGMAGSDSD